MLNLFAGILIGFGAILPGISSGVFLCCFGLYEKIIDTIIHFYKDIKNNIKFMTPIILGIFIGVFLFGNVLRIVYSKFNMESSFAFIGLILGSIKLVTKQANIKRINFLHIICMLLTFTFSIYLIALESRLNIISDVHSNSYLILAGVFMSAGVVIPGISKTVILMLLGLYEMYLAAISTIDLSFLIPIGIGLLLGGIIFLCLINFLFKFAKSYTYFGIIGFILGSILVIYPGFTFDIRGLVSILLLVISFITGLILSKYEKS